MNISQTALFKDVSDESIDAVMHCFGPVTRKFKKNETIAVFSPESQFLYVMSTGKAHLYCIDSDGEFAVLEHYGPNDIFGVVFSMPSEILGYAVVADTNCEVVLFPLSSIYGRCQNACYHHTQISKNLFELSAKKTQAMAVRINIISKKTVRRKLLAYFEYMAEKNGSKSFELETSLTNLSNLLCIDRANMMRELKNMTDDGTIKRNGKIITIE